MLFHKSLPKGADIFIESKKNRHVASHYKTFKKLKILSIIMSSVVILFGAAILFVPGKSAAQDMFACPQTSGNGNGCNNWWYTQNNNGWNNQNGDQNQGNNNDVTISPLNPAPLPQNNFVVDSTPIQQIVSPEPPIDQNGTNQPTGQDIGGLSGQIVTAQQQIAQQMQSCVSNAKNMADQINGLIGQQKSLQKQLDALNSQTMPNFDTSTTQGQQQEQAWQQQQQDKQQKQQQAIDALSTTISTDENNMSNANSQCQQNVSQLEQNRSQMESNLDTAFSNAMNIQIQQ